MSGLEILGAVLTGISTFTGIAGSIQAGNAAKAAAEYEAQQLEIKANEDRAAAQRAAEEQDRDRKFVQSRQRAVAASSGFGAGALDTTVMQLMGDVEEQAELNKLQTRAAGENRARGREDQATLRRFEGAQEKRAALFKAAGIGLSGGADFFSKYGGGGFGGDGVEGFEGGGRYYR